MSYLVFGSGSCGIGAEPVGQAVGAGEHAEHARHGLGARRIDAADAGMRMRGAHHYRIGLAVDAEVIAEAAMAGDEPRVLFARRGLADGLEIRLVHGDNFLLHWLLRDVGQRSGVFYHYRMRLRRARTRHGAQGRPAGERGLIH